MADDTTIYAGENSPDYIAYRLMRDIAIAEDKKMYGIAAKTPPDRKWILDTYAECRLAVMGRRDWKPGDH